MLHPATILLAGTLAFPAAAETIRVRPDGAGEVPLIADALLIASAGDVISLAPGTYLEHDLAWPSGVRLVAESDDPAETILDAQGLGRCIDAAGTGPGTLFRGITFANGVSSTDGGLVYAEGSLADFRSCVFRNGSAARGGALFVSAAGIDRCEFRENAATRGGAVFCRKDDALPAPSLSGCLFEENTAVETGGAVHSEGDQSFEDGTYLLASTFRGNSAREGGAAYLHQYDAVHVCRFFDNVATASGGALWLTDLVPNERASGIQSSVFARNTAAFGGGIAVADGSPASTLVFIANTMVENRAATGAHLGFHGRGGGFFWRSILASGLDGSAVAGGWPIGVSCFDVWDNAGGDWVGPLEGQGEADGNFSIDPWFVDAEAGDFRVSDGSACLAPLTPGCGAGVGALGEARERNARLLSWP